MPRKNAFGAPTVLIAGWAGAQNLGDELLHEVLIAELQRLDVTVEVLTGDPDDTLRRHGVRGVGHQEPIEVWRALRRADLLILGPGGILQDETSVLSLPAHLTRPGIARLLRTPIAGIGLGVGPIGRRGSTVGLRRVLSNCAPLHVRDALSQRLLEHAGLGPIEITADLGWLAEPAADRDPQASLAVALRPWAASSTGFASVRRSADRESVDAGRTEQLAAALDQAAADLGAERIDFVSFQPPRDTPQHERLASLVSIEAVVHEPATTTDAIELLSRSQVVIAGRFHTLVLAGLAGRPAVALPYAPKLADLAEKLEGCVALNSLHPTAAELSAAVADAATRAPQMIIGRDLERSDAARVRTVVEAAVARVRGKGGH